MFNTAQLHTWDPSRDWEGADNYFKYRVVSRWGWPMLTTLRDCLSPGQAFIVWTDSLIPTTYIIIGWSMGGPAPSPSCMYTTCIINAHACTTCATYTMACWQLDSVIILVGTCTGIVLVIKNAHYVYRYSVCVD